MQTRKPDPAVTPNTAEGAVPHPTIAELVGEVYEAAPPTWRCRMLEHLMKPLGALALVGVCNGIFSKIWFRTGMQDLVIGPEDAQSVRSVDVISLVGFVQQASTDTINSLTALLANSPMLAYSTAAAMLMSILLQRIRRLPQREAVDPPESDTPGSGRAY